MISAILLLLFFPEYYGREISRQDGDGQLKEASQMIGDTDGGGGWLAVKSATWTTYNGKYRINDGSTDL